MYFNCIKCQRFQWSEYIVCNKKHWPFSISIFLIFFYYFKVNECKEQLQAQSDELDMMLSSYKETQLTTNQKLATLRGDKPVTSVRASEICFKHAQWRLTEADGQLSLIHI